MKYCKFIVLFFFIISVFSCKSVQPSLLSAIEYDRLMQMTDDNWNVVFENDEIIITSNELYWFYNAVSLPLMDEDEFISYIKESGHQDYYEIRLHFVPKWNEDKLNKAKITNEKIWEEIHQLPEKHGVTHLTRTKMNSYFPETDEDKVKVVSYDKEYNALIDKLIRIPDYHSDNYSVFRDDNRIGFEAVWNENMHYINLKDIFLSFIQSEKNEMEGSVKSSVLI